MDGLGFEMYCADLLRAEGYKKVEVTRASGDQGVDVLATKDGEKYAIQCKYYSNPVSNAAVQQVLAGALYYGCDKAVVMTNSTFTKSARELAEKTGVILWEGIDSPNGKRYSHSSTKSSGGCLKAFGILMAISFPVWLFQEHTAIGIGLLVAGVAVIILGFVLSRKDPLVELLKDAPDTSAVGDDVILDITRDPNEQIEIVHNMVINGSSSEDAINEYTQRKGILTFSHSEKDNLKESHNIEPHAFERDDYMSNNDYSVESNLLQDELLLDALDITYQSGFTSVSALQRRFRIGYYRASQILDTFAELGIVSPASDSSHKREVLIPKEEAIERVLASSFQAEKEEPVQIKVQSPDLTWEENEAFLRSQLGDLVDYEKDGELMNHLNNNIFVENCNRDAMNEMLELLIAKNSSKYLYLYLMDDFGFYQQLMGKANQIDATMASTSSPMQFVTRLQALIKDRQETLINEGMHDVKKYNLNHAESPIPKVVLFIMGVENYQDNLGELFQQVCLNGPHMEIVVIACSIYTMKQSSFKTLSSLFTICKTPEEALALISGE